MDEAEKDTRVEAAAVEGIEPHRSHACARTRAVLFPMLALCAALAPLGAWSEEPRLRVGVVSDSHIRQEPGSDAFFLKALRWFDAQKIDALAISGDLTDQQMILEIEHFMSCYQSVFKDGKRSDGGPVTPVFVTGNHDDEGYVYIAGRCNGLRGEAISKVAGNTKWSLERMQNDVSNSVANATRAIELNVPADKAAPVLTEIRTLGDQAAATTNAAGLAALSGAFGTAQSNAVALLTDNAFLCNVNITSVWKRVLGEDYSQFFHKRVKGYDFVGANWNGIGWGGAAFDLEGYLASLDLPKDRPFFYVQHPHPKDTCHGHWVWGHDNGSSTAVLEKYPNVIALSGHSHTPVADERAIWQGTFTSIGCGSLYYPGSINGREQARDEKKVGRDGLLFSVYEDRVVVERRDFLNDAEIEPKWVFPAPTFGGGEARPYTPAVRRQTEPIPEFAKDAAVGVAFSNTNAPGSGRACDVTATFPFARVADKGFDAAEYEVQVERVVTDYVQASATKRVLPPRYYGAAPFRGTNVSTRLRAGELPAKTPFRIAVRPMNAFGGKGEPIYSDSITF